MANDPSRERFELWHPCSVSGLPTGDAWVKLVFIGGRLMSKSYFNTTSETGPQLAEYRAKAGEQNEMVMRIFRTITWPLSPSQVLSYFPAPQPPLTSIRRAISTLTKAGALVKTETKRKGIYNRAEFVWRLPEANDSAVNHPVGTF